MLITRIRLVLLELRSMIGMPQTESWLVVGVLPMTVFKSRYGI